jgi:hypothetical protein
MNSGNLKEVKSTLKKVSLLYTNNNSSEIEIKKLIPFKISYLLSIFKNKVTMNKFNHKVRKLYHVNHNALHKEIEEDTCKEI